jgi:plasmid stabilization system protein ParE
MYEAARYYDQQVNGLGWEFLENVQRSIDTLREYPELGPVADAPLRRQLLTRFPFPIVYLIESKTLVIIAVARHRRRPGYWAERLDS